MQINISTQQGRVPVTIMHLDGDLDASNYADAIQKAQELYEGGVRNLILDLSRVPFMSSAGLMAIHTIALIFGGGHPTKVEGGRPSFRAVDPQRDIVARERVKLLNPQKQVSQVLDVVGLKQFFQIFDTQQNAVDSF
jgi:anti-anti-sigma regulatory factor